jgi:hypothetical protein
MKKKHEENEARLESKLLEKKCIRLPQLSNPIFFHFSSVLNDVKEYGFAKLSSIKRSLNSRENWTMTKDLKLQMLTLLNWAFITER